MMKPYKVECFSIFMDMEMNCICMEQAEEVYLKALNSGLYFRGHIVSNETGEVICHFSKTIEANGLKTETWSAF